MLSFILLIVFILVLPRQFIVLSQSISSAELRVDNSQPSSAQIQTVLPLSITDKRFTLFTWSSTSADNNDNNAPSVMAREAFTFHLKEPAILQLIDFKHPGDRFQVFDNDQPLGKTTLPKAMEVSKDEDQGSLYAGTPALAMEDKRERYSKGQILLAAGNHTITIEIWAASPSIDVHGTDVSGGAIRLVNTPMRPQKLYRGLGDGDDGDDYDNDDDDDDDDDDGDNDDDDDDDDDDDERDDGYWDGDVVTATVTVMVPPATKDKWDYHTGLRVMTVTDALGVSAATYTPPAGRTELIRNPRCGMN